MGVRGVEGHLPLLPSVLLLELQVLVMKGEGLVDLLDLSFRLAFLELE